MEDSMPNAGPHTTTVQVSTTDKAASHAAASHAGTHGSDPDWTPAHRKHLTSVSQNLAGNWVAENLDETDAELTALVKRAFRYAFDAGAGCNHELHKRGVH